MSAHPPGAPPPTRNTNPADPLAVSISLSDGVRRRCPRCGRDLPVEAFARDATKASGRKSACRECDAAKARAYYAANRERVIARVVARKAAGR